MPCRHRTSEICSYTSKQCLGAKYDDKKGEYVVSVWQEKACPDYEPLEEKEISSKTPWNLKEGEPYTVLIRIFGIEQSFQRGGDIAPEGRSVKEDAEVLEALLNRRYVGGIKVEGIGMDSSEMENFPEIREIAEAKNAYLVVTIDDEIKFINEVPLDLIKEEVEKRGLKKK